LSNKRKSQLFRRRARAKARTHASARQNDEAAQRRNDWERRQRRRYIAYGLMALGVLIAGTHLLEHAGAFQVIDNNALQDILIGYPTGGILFVVGLALLPAQRY
jgi:hypothetical protein